MPLTHQPLWDDDYDDTMCLTDATGAIEKRYFDVNGALLILAPWKPETIGAVNGVPIGTDYSIFHNLNHLVEEICSFDGDARLVRNV